MTEDIKLDRVQNIKTENEIPSAFSNCANCSVSYTSSAQPIESVLLVCLHSFCKKCINDGCLRSDKGDPNLVTCCKCKCNSNRADCGINLLADAEPQLDRNLNSKHIKCSSCNDQTIATSQCTVCDDMLCDACVSAHKRVKLTRDHPITSLDICNGTHNGASNNKISKRYSCAKHSTEKLHFYCEQCNKVTCTKCHDSTGDHFNHKFSEVAVASSNFRKNLALQLQNLTEKEQTVGQALDIVNEKMADVEEAEAKALTEVREYYNTCMERLRIRMNALGSEIKKLAASKRQILEKTKDDVGHLQARLDETIKAVSYVGGSNDAIAILSVRKGMSHHMATLLKLKCQVPNPSHKLAIQLQTEPSLISQVIPGIGKILVDGVVTPAHPTPTQITNGIRHPPPVHQPHAVRQPAPVRPSPPVTVRQPTPPARAPVPAGQNTAAKGRQLAPYAPIQPKPELSPISIPGPPLLSLAHGKVPVLVVTQGGANADLPSITSTRSPTAVSVHNNPLPLSAQHPIHNQLLSPQPLRHSLPHPQFVTLTSHTTCASTVMSPSEQMSSIPASDSPTLQISSVSSGAPVFPGPPPPPATSSQTPAPVKPSNSSDQPPIKIKLRLDGNKDPLAVNGEKTSKSRHSSSNENKNKRDSDSSIKISSVMSLAKSHNGTPETPPTSNGTVTPTRDRDHPVAKKRRKAPLSPYHISTQHSPDDPNEDYCAVCHNGGELICCDTCPKVYHANCHVPELTGAPSSFSCSLCWDEKELPSTPESAGNKRKAPSGLSDYEVKMCEKILLKMFCHKRSLAFHLPVPKTVKHYSTTIKNPMDFISIRKKLMRQHFNHYNSIKEFINDMRLVFSNCVAFNGPISDYTESARMVQEYFVEHIEKHFSVHKELASSILPPDEVMNTSVFKKHKGDQDAVVHFS